MTGSLLTCRLPQCLVPFLKMLAACRQADMFAGFQSEEAGRGGAQPWLSCPNRGWWLLARDLRDRSGLEWGTGGRALRYSQARGGALPTLPSAPCAAAGKVINLNETKEMREHDAMPAHRRLCRGELPRLPGLPAGPAGST